MPSPARFVSKLRRMSADEVVCRARALGTRFVEEQLFRLGLDTDPHAPGGGTGHPDYPYPFCSSTELGDVARRLAGDTTYLQQVRAEADAVCRGEFSFFGTSFRLDPHRIPWTS